MRNYKCCVCRFIYTIFSIIFLTFDTVRAENRENLAGVECRFAERDAHGFIMRIEGKFPGHSDVLESTPRALSLGTKRRVAAVTASTLGP